MQLKKYNVYETLDKTLIQGRVGKITDRGIPLFWSASAVEFNVTGEQFWFEYECPFHVVGFYLRIEVDGADIARFMITQGIHQVCAFGNLEPEKIKNVRIYREMQADAPIIIKSVSTDGEICPITKRKHKIEFIGDSITAGVGLGGNKCHQRSEPFICSNRGLYALTVAKELDADYSIVAIAGYGVHSSWDNKPHHVMPLLYDRVCGFSEDEIQTELGSQDMFDFANDRTDITVVNLGTNDAGAFKNAAWIDENGTAHKHEFDENGKPCERDYNLIKNAIIDVCKAIHKTRPDGYIFWCYNVMEDNVNDIVIDALNEYSATENDKKAFSVKLTIPDDSGMGSVQHPGAKAHALYAEALVEKIRMCTTTIEKEDYESS